MSEGADDNSTKACGEDHGLAVWFTPAAIREHFDQDTDGPTIPENVTDDDLARAAADVITGDDNLWTVFDHLTGEIVRLAERDAEERAAKAAGSTGART